MLDRLSPPTHQYRPRNVKAHYLRDSDRGRFSWAAEHWVHSGAPMPIMDTILPWHCKVFGRLWPRSAVVRDRDRLGSLERFQ